MDVMYCIAPSDIPFRPGAGHWKTVAFGMGKKYNETVSRYFSAIWIPSSLGLVLRLALFFAAAMAL